MPGHKVLIPRASDQEIGKFFKEVCNTFSLAHFSYSQIGVYDAGQANVKDMPQIFAQKATFTINHASVSHGNYPISFNRGSGGNEPSYAFDHITLGNNNYDSNRTKIDAEQATALHGFVQKYFHNKKEMASAVFGDPKAFGDVILSHQNIISRLEESLASVGERFAEERIKLQRELDETKVSLEEEYQARLAKLSESEAALEERKRALDDRDNTHARREIRSDLKRRLDEHTKSFRLTAGTQSLRRPIHALASVSLFIIGALIAFYSLQTFSTLTQSTGAVELFLAVIKPLGLTLAFLGILTWYIRWMNRWFERHAEAEFQLKQFELDIDRASWVVETALEWRQTQETAMPNHLIESISRNLFSKSEKDEGADMHPADYLASALLGRASGLRLKLPGGEIEYGSKALKEAAHTAEKAGGK